MTGHESQEPLESLDRALKNLRQRTDAPVWSRDLERTAIDRALRARNRRAWRQPLTVVLALVFAGGAVSAATGGMQWLRGLFATVDIDGESTRLPVPDEGRRTRSYRGGGGYGTITVERTPVDEAGGVKTRLQLQHRSGDAPTAALKHDLDAHEVDERRNARSRPTLPRQAVAGLEPLATWVTHGHRYALYALQHEGQRRLFCGRTTTGMLRLASPTSPPPRATARVRRVDEDSVVVELSAPGYSAELRFTVRSAADELREPHRSPRPLRVQTPDGRVRVEMPAPTTRR